MEIVCGGKNIPVYLSVGIKSLEMGSVKKDPHRTGVDVWGLWRVLVTYILFSSSSDMRGEAAPAGEDDELLEELRVPVLSVSGNSSGNEGRRFSIITFSDLLK